MEQNTSFPVLGEGYYKELEQQKNELNKQAQMLLAEEEVKGKQQMIDQAVEETKTDSPVKKAPSKKKTKQEEIEDAMMRGIQVYHWIKIPEDHLETLKMKKLRGREHGETMTIIYLKILLLSLKWNGYIYYEGVGDSIEEEIASIIDEDKDLVEKTILFMIEYSLLTVCNEKEAVFAEEFKTNTGSDSDKERKRMSRARKENAKRGIFA